MIGNEEKTDPEAGAMMAGQGEVCPYQPGNGVATGSDESDVRFRDVKNYCKRLLWESILGEGER